MQASSNEIEIVIADDSNLELFCSYIRDAVINRTRAGLQERFSAIRLESAPINYAQALNHLYGHTNGLTISINTMQSRRALDLADTVIHELAHVMVGTQNDHNENWRDAATALGLVSVTTRKQRSEWEDFDSGTQKVIREAIERFTKDHPKLVVSADIEIPWPSYVGLHDCGRAHEAWHACYEDDGKTMHHRHHVLRFQIEGIRDGLRRLSIIQSWLLADEMGLGKTLQIIGVINATHPKRILIGCPNNAKLVWLRHFKEFCVHPYDVEVAYSNMYMYSDVVIMNYEAMIKWGPTLASQEWDLVIYDEGHYLKSPSAKRSKTAYKIRGKWNIIVTGSPIVNYPFEVFPLAHHLNRPNFPEYARFEAQFGSRTSEKLGRNLPKLNALLRATIMTRREKKEVELQFPRKRRQVVEFEVPDEVRPLIESEKKLWDQMRGNSQDVAAVTFLNAMRNDSDVADSDFDWAAIIEAMQATKKFAFEEMARIAHQIGLAKFTPVVEFLENAIEAREKVLVFGHHRDVLTRYRDHFGRDRALLLLGGNTDQAAATAAFEERFNSDSNIVIGFAQVSNAQAYSIKSADTVIFVEEDWVPGVMTQAEDRSHGIGRGVEGGKSLMIYHLTFVDSLDTYKAKLTIKKQKSIDRAVGMKK